MRRVVRRVRRRMKCFEEFAAQHAVRILIGLTALMATATLCGGYVLVTHDRELVGVRYAGPCRARGIEYEECRLMARLVLAACADQKNCARKYGITDVHIRRGR